MNDISRTIHPPADLDIPSVRLNGSVDDRMLRTFLDALVSVQGGNGPLGLELTTLGGDADVGRRIATDVRLFQSRSRRPAWFFGKAVVYSAGVTVMSAFPRESRWLADGTRLLIHCRKLDKSVCFNGPLKGERLKVEALLAEIETGIRMEEADFRRLIHGSDVSLAELLERGESGWYLDADEALRRGLIAGVI